MCRFKINQIDDVIASAVECLHISPTDPDFPFEVMPTMRLESRKRVIGEEKFNVPQLCTNEVFISRPTCERVIL